MQKHILKAYKTIENYALKVKGSSSGPENMQVGFFAAFFFFFFKF